MSRKFIVLLASIVFNLTVGVLYSWSIIKSFLMKRMNWTPKEASLPFTIAISSFALGLFIGGRIQDKIGPKKIVTLGGILVGVGLLLSSFFTHSPGLLALSFGVLSGLGIGFGYGCVTPPCLKWFHPSQKGLISGLVVGAFGLGALFYSPITNALLESTGDLSRTLQTLGLAVMVITFLASRFISNPDPSYTPQTPRRYKAPQGGNPANTRDIHWRDMLRYKQFYLTFLIFAFGSSVGLMIIGNMKTIFDTQVGVNTVITGTMMVSLLSIFNAGGRILAGGISDKLGANNTLLITAALQGVIMLLFPFITTPVMLILGCVVVGYSYGSYLSVVPAITVENFGLKQYGTNYGITYQAWGIAGILAPMTAAIIGITRAYHVAAGFSFFVLTLGLILKVVGPVEEKEGSRRPEEG